MGISVDAVGGHLHWMQTRKSVLVGGAAPYFCSLNKGGGHRRDPWWRHETPEEMPRETL